MGDALELAWGGARLQGDSVRHWTRGELLIVLRRSSGDEGAGVADATADEILFRPSLFPTLCQSEDAPPRSLPSNSREELNIALSVGAFYGFCSPAVRNVGVYLHWRLQCETEARLILHKLCQESARLNGEV